MFYFKDLRAERHITGEHVLCPVKGCSKEVERQRVQYQKVEAYKCTKHDIYISPSTFEYENYENNLLWFDSEASHGVGPHILRF